MRPTSYIVFEQYELVVLDAGLDFTLDIGRGEDQRADFPHIEIDEQRLEQALFNLVSNAMKFTSTGGIIRLALAVDETEDPSNVIISVQDSGMGIPPDQARANL